MCVGWEWKSEWSEWREGGREGARRIHFQFSKKKVKVDLVSTSFHQVLPPLTSKRPNQSPPPDATSIKRQEIGSDSESEVPLAYNRKPTDDRPDITSSPDFNLATQAEFDPIDSPASTNELITQGSVDSASDVIDLASDVINKSRSNSTGSINPIAPLRPRLVNDSISTIRSDAPTTIAPAAPKNEQTFNVTRSELQAMIQLEIHDAIKEVKQQYENQIRVLQIENASLRASLAGSRPASSSSSFPIGPNNNNSEHYESNPPQTWSDAARRSGVRLESNENDPPQTWAEAARRAKAKFANSTANDYNDIIRPNFRAESPTPISTTTAPPRIIPFFRSFTTNETKHSLCYIYVVGLRPDMRYSEIRSTLQRHNFPISAILNISKISTNTHEFIVRTAYAGVVSQCFLSIGAKVLENFTMNRSTSTEKQITWNAKRLYNLLRNTPLRNSIAPFIRDELFFIKNQFTQFPNAFTDFNDYISHPTISHPSSPYTFNEMLPVNASSTNSINQ